MAPAPTQRPFRPLRLPTHHGHGLRLQQLRGRHDREVGDVDEDVTHGHQRDPDDDGQRQVSGGRWDTRLSAGHHVLPSASRAALLRCPTPGPRAWGISQAERASLRDSPVVEDKPPRNQGLGSSTTPTPLAATALSPGPPPHKAQETEGGDKWLSSPPETEGQWLPVPSSPLELLPMQLSYLKGFLSSSVM